jgi:16S rRNA (guanine527-N7)-methyltransferase
VTAGPDVQRAQLPQADVVRAAASQLAVALPDGAAERLAAYLALIFKWNRVYNLTALRAPSEMLSHHLVDSLAVIGPLRRYTRGEPRRLLDVGSGAGLPGVVIAICCPEIQVDCVDTVAKKAAFIRQVALELKLPNLHSHHARVENLLGPYDLITSRAFASLSDFVSWSRAALDLGGAWMALKGKHPEHELAALPPDVQVFHVEQLSVPNLDAERCIVWIKPVPLP